MTVVTAKRHRRFTAWIGPYQFRGCFRRRSLGEPEIFPAVNIASTMTTPLPTLPATPIALRLELDGLGSLLAYTGSPWASPQAAIASKPAGAPHSPPPGDLPTLQLGSVHISSGPLQIPTHLLRMLGRPPGHSLPAQIPQHVLATWAVSPLSPSPLTHLHKLSRNSYLFNHHTVMILFNHR